MKTQKTQTRKSTPTKPAKPSATRKLLPVMRPSQNMREIIKQCIMLEDHLVQPCKRCPDCTSKHMLAIEALAEECGTLCDPKNRETAGEASKVAQNARVLHHTWATNPGDPATCRAVAGKLRKMRKQLMMKYATLPLEKLPTKEQRVIKRLTRLTRLTRKGSKKPQKSL